MRFSAFISQSKTTYKTAPIELKLFFFFSLVVSITAFSIEIFGSKQLNETIIPIVGWSFTGAYPIHVMFTGLLMILPVIKNRIRIRNTLIFLLLITIVFAAIPYLSLEKADFVNPNPYLRMSEWRPLWVFVIPSFWIFILLSPRIKKYCTAED